MRALLAVLLLTGLATAYAQNIQRYNDSDPFEDLNKNRVVVSGTNLHDSYDDPFLVWRCDGNNKFEIYVAVDESKWLDSDPINLRYRFDEQQPERETWGPSTDGIAAFAKRYHLIDFTAQAITSNKVVFGIKDFSDVEHVVEFRLAGLKNYLQQLGCVSWEKPPPRGDSRSQFFPGPPKQVFNYLKELLIREGESFPKDGSSSTLSSQNFEVVVLPITRQKLLGSKLIRTKVSVTASRENHKLIHNDGSYEPMFRFGVQAEPGEVDKVVREVLGDMPITEKFNRMHVEGLDIHFFSTDERTYLAFDGINDNLYLELKNALKEKYKTLFP